MHLPQDIRGELKQRLTPANVFLLLLLLAELITLVMLISTRGGAWGELLFFDTGDSFMDYFNSIYTFERHEVGELYHEVNSFYPPLAQLFYLVLHAMIPAWAMPPDAYVAREVQITALPFCLYVILTSVLVACTLSAAYRDKSSKNKLFVVLAFCSAPMLFQFERANIIFVAFLFTLLFLRWYDDPNRVKRELALIALAVAAGLKIYPALFGLLLVADRRWRETARCVVYGLLSFFLPSIAFGGVNPLKLLAGLGDMNGNVAAEGVGHKVNFSNTFTALAKAFGGEGNGTVFAVLAVLIGILCVVALFCHTSLWKRLTLIAVFIAGVPSFSYLYVMIFFLLPTVAFLNESDSKTHTIMDYIYAVGLVACLAPLPFSGYWYGMCDYPVTFTMWVESLALLALAALLVGEAAVMLYRRCRKARCACAAKEAL